MIRDRIKQKIKFCIIILVITIAIAVAIFSVLKYEVEGEKEVPFELEKIIVISSADITDVVDENMTDTETTEQTATENLSVDGGDTQTPIDNQTNSAEESNEQVPAQEESYIWEKNVIQTNDICIVLDKNEDFKEGQYIKNVKIKNIQILQNVNLGKIQVYMPSSLDGEMYKYTNEYLVNSSLTYTGAPADNKKNLQIRNQGGCIYISFANVGLSQYKSNDDQEIQQGAFILEKMNVANEDLKFKVSFDLVIEVEDMSYKTNVVLDLPVDGVVGQKETHMEITDFSDVVFKREVSLNP